MVDSRLVAEYFQQAAASIEVPQRMSVRADRDRMVEMAQYRLDKARKAEPKAGPSES